ncbi:PREDICTED: tetratricopeptide repeat protein 28-like [Branchiostoma belcheri]|uniref:Tetratricopeptide repeat protein 28-like n=1 Tax=Branchiostoma belcheri TaxID=7741 RepID=A0A6P4ZGM6_BRABE|nr:PREDICTED: tetratricopeptide repeat protein 28-like [Branchiostoma belcheri]
MEGKTVPLDSLSKKEKEILFDRLENMITEDKQSDAEFDEMMERYRQLKTEVMNKNVSVEGRKILLRIIDKNFSITVLQNGERFRKTMERFHKVKLEILELCKGSVLCKVRFYHRDSQVEFVSACRDGTLSAILTEEYISQELVEICGGMPLHVHIEVDEEDFQRGADISHGETPPHNHGQSTHTVDQTAALTADSQQMELLQQDPTTGTSSPGFDNQETTDFEEPGETDVPPEISELVSLDIRELEQLMGKPRKKTFSVSSQSSGYGTGPSGSAPSRPFSYTGEIDTKDTLEVKGLLAELNTPVVKQDKAQQFDLYCQIGDLYRTKLHNSHSALQYYQNMLECSQELSEDTKQAKAYNRLGLTCDILGLPQEAFRNHEKALAIYKIETKNETDICVAYKNLASSLALSGQVSDAKINYESALAVAMETGNKTEQMDIYCKLGDLHREQLHEPQESHKYYTEMLALARDLGRKDWESLAYNRLGRARYDMGEHEETFEWDKRDLKMSQESGDKTGQITAHQNIADSYKALGKLDLARSHYQSAMTIAMETGNKAEQMDIYCKLGDLHREQLHEPQESHKYYTEMLALARDLGRKEEEGDAYNRLGLAHYDMGEYEESLEWHKKDLKMRQETGDKTEQITAHQCVADSYKALGKLDLARSHYQSAMTIAMETGNKTQQMDIYCGLGDLHRVQLHEPQESHKYYTEMLALARDLGRKEEESLGYNKLDLARSHYQSAMTIAMETGNKTEQMDIYLQLGDLHREQLHEPQESHKYYTEMLALARDLGRKDRESQAYNRLGLAHYDMGEYEESLEWHKKALKMRQESADKTEQITAHQNIADSYKALGKLDLARSHYQSATTIAMETGNKQKQEDIAKKLANL